LRLNYTQKTIDWATRTSLKTDDELRCSGMVSNVYSIRDICPVTLVKLICYLMLQ
jgi:hypothetical protein